MPSVVETLQVLERYADLLGVLAVLPVLSDIKFGPLLRAQELGRRLDSAAGQNAASSGGGADGSGEAADSAGGEKEGDGSGPGRSWTAEPASHPCAEATSPQSEPTSGSGLPAWALVLVLLAEVVAAMPLLDPSDRLVRRAWGNMVRSQKKSGESGLLAVIQKLEKLLQDEDVYQLVSSVAIVVGVSSLIISSLFGAGGNLDSFRGGPRSMLRAFSRMCKTSPVGKALGSPRAWFALLVLASYWIANSEPLLRLARKSAVVELLKASGKLWRTLGFVGAAMWGSSAQESSPLPAWATLQAASITARVAHLVVQERLSLDGFLGESTTGAPSDAVKGILALEACGLIVLLPHAFARRKLRVLSVMLFLPILLLVGTGGMAEAAQPYFEGRVHQLSFCTAVLSLCLVFLGGFSTMMSCVLVMQLLVQIHSLDKIKF